jgi:hypothetical protein
MGATGPGPRLGISSAWFRMQYRHGEVTGQRLPMVEAWILYIFRVSCPFWERFSSYSSHGMESRASRGLLHGLEEDEAVTAQGDITVGASSSRVIYHLHWSPFLKPNRVEPLEVQAQGPVQVPLDMPLCGQEQGSLFRRQNTEGLTLLGATLTCLETYSDAEKRTLPRTLLPVTSWHARGDPGNLLTQRCRRTISTECCPLVLLSYAFFLQKIMMIRDSGRAHCMQQPLQFKKFLRH